MEESGAIGSDDAQGSRHTAEDDAINMSNIIYSMTASKESAVNGIVGKVIIDRKPNAESMTISSR